MVIRYYLKNQGSAKAAIGIANAQGQTVAKLDGPTAAGINSVVWSTRAQEAEGRNRWAVDRGRGNVLNQWAPLGEYTVTLELGGRTFTQKAQITKTQGWSIGAVPRTIR